VCRLDDLLVVGGVDVVFNDIDSAAVELHAPQPSADDALPTLVHVEQLTVVDHSFDLIVFDDQGVPPGGVEFHVVEFQLIDVDPAVDLAPTSARPSR
jgi:hypothetical protein